MSIKKHIVRWHFQLKLMSFGKLSEAIYCDDCEVSALKNKTRLRTFPAHGLLDSWLWSSSHIFYLPWFPQTTERIFRDESYSNCLTHNNRSYQEMLNLYSRVIIIYDCKFDSLNKKRIKEYISVTPLCPARCLIYGEFLHMLTAKNDTMKWF